MIRSFRFLCLGFTICTVSVFAQTGKTSEFRAARAYDAAVKAGPAALRTFLELFPKGADLHNHLSGAVYAETFLKDAVEDGMCIHPVTFNITNPPCAAPLMAAADATKSQDLYDKLVNAFSMRSFVPSPGFSGHDQFFSTFGRFQSLNKSHTAEWVDEVANRAAAQNEQYLELMYTPAFSHAIQIAHELGWHDRSSREEFAQFRQELINHGLREEVAADREEIRTAEAHREELEHCGTQMAGPVCRVKVRYIYQVLRGNLPEQVFAQTLLGFETIQASMDAHEQGFVGINFVMPEDGYLSMRDYTLQMQMLDYLHSVYPQVPITLHAGELALGLVPPEGLRFHIRQAVELGHALRIGHGVDVMHENNADQLLKDLARKHVMVEINLTSNDGILGVKGADHPFMMYRAAHVPVALSTDDEGVSRIDITHEYVRAALDYHLSFSDLKQLARTGMEHNFLPGASLWASPDIFSTLAAPCRMQTTGGKPSATCKAFLDGNEKAAAQWELERRFMEFELRF